MKKAVKDKAARKKGISPRALDTVRTIWHSKSRFLAILAMTALGALVFIGLQTTPPIMRATLEREIRQAKMEDLTISSPLGLYEEDIKRIDALPGVKKVSYVYTGDYYLNKTDKIIHLISISDGMSLPLMTEGRMPQKDDEILLDDEARAKGGYKLGDKVTLITNQSVEDEKKAKEEGSAKKSTSDDVKIDSPEDPTEKDLLTRTEFTVVGFARDIHYFGYGRGTARMGNGTIDYFGYAMRDVFKKTRPSRAILEMNEFNGLRTYDGQYRDKEMAMLDEIRPKFEDRPNEIRDNIRSDVEKQIADGEKKLDDARQKIADGQKKLDDSKQELADGRADYEKGIADYNREMADGQKKLDDAKKQLEDSKKKLDQGTADYEKGHREFLDGEAKLQKSRKELNDGWAKVSEGEKQLADARKKLGDLKADQVPGMITDLEGKLKQVNDGLAQIEEGLKKFPYDIPGFEKVIADLKAQQTDLQGKLSQAENGLAQAQQLLPTLKEQLTQLETGLAQAQQKKTELETAKAELEPHIYDLQSSVNTLTEAATVLQSKIDALDPTDPGYEAKKKELENQLAEVNEKLEQAKAALAPLQEKMTQIEGGLAEVQKTIDTLTAQKQQLEAGIKQAEDAIATLPAQITAIKDGLKKIEDGIKQAEDGLQKRKEVEEKQKQLLDNKKQLEDGIAKLKQAQAAFETIAKEQAKLDSARKKLNEGERNYEQGKSLLEANRKKLEHAKKELDDGRAKYEDGLAKYNTGVADLEKGRVEGRQKLDDAKAKLDDGEKKYEDGLATFTTEKADAEKKIADGQKAIDDAKKELDRIRIPSYNVLGRHNEYMINTYLDEADSLNAMSYIFSTVFYLIALLVSLTTLTRMVDEERTQIGTLKALGYRNSTIISKYLIYAAISASAGTLLGIGLGYGILMPTVFNAYSSSLNIPGDPVLMFNPLLAVAALGVSLGVTMIAAWASAQSSLREKAAELMRPKPPSNGHRILLERFTFIWKRMSFMMKVTARNLTAKKGRMWMTILGVAGCTGLIAMGFGIQDSVSGLFGKQYGMLQRYDLQILYDTNAKDKDLAKIDDYLKSVSAASAHVHYETGTFVNNKGIEETFSLIIPTDPETFRSVITLQDRKTKKQLPLDDKGVILTEKMADGLHIKNSGEVSVKDAEGYSFKVPVEAKCENYVQHKMFMTQKRYEETFHEEAKPNVILTKLNADADHTAVVEKLLDMEGVVTVIQMKDTTTFVNDIVSSLRLVVLVIILISSMLAFIVLFNLTNLNVSERLRELSTIKVLGFRSVEVTEYIYRESLALSIIGIIIGFGVGKIMHLAICVALSPSEIMLDPELRTLSYIVSALITFAFSLLVMVIVHFKLKRVDMVEALKAVE